MFFCSFAGAVVGSVGSQQEGCRFESGALLCGVTGRSEPCSVSGSYLSAIILMGSLMSKCEQQDEEDIQAVIGPGH